MDMRYEKACRCDAKAIMGGVHFRSTNGGLTAVYEPGPVCMKCKMPWRVKPKKIAVFRGQELVGYETLGGPEG